MTEDVIKDEGHKLEKCRQPFGADHLNQLMTDAHEAQFVLKNAFINRPPQNDVSTDEWARAVFQQSGGDTIPNYVTKGLMDFVMDFNGVITDPGTLTKEDVLRKKNYKYMGDLTRCKDIARLRIEFRTARALLDSYNDIKLKLSRNCSVVKVRNLFKEPTNLGERKIVLFVECILKRGVKHIASVDLYLTRDWAAKEKANSLFRVGLRQILMQECQIQKKETVEEVDEFLQQQINSSSIQSGDAVYFKNTEEETLLRVEKEQVGVHEAAPLMQGNFFFIISEKGVGPIKAGDTVYLKSRLTGKFISALGSGSVNARPSSMNTEEGT